MPGAFGHLVVGWSFGKVFENFKKGFKITRIGWFLLLFGALVPDADYLLQWTTNIHVHRTFTHSILMIIISFIVAYLFFLILNKLNFKILDNHDTSLVAMASLFSLGIITHLLADMALGWPGVPLFWPLETHYYFFGVVHNYVSSLFSELSAMQLSRLYKMAILDMAIGVVWIGYLFFKGKIKEF